MRVELTRTLAAAIVGASAFVVPGAIFAADDDVYTVANYPVDAEAKSAVAAKKKALADGQEAAFRSLLKRVVPVTDYDRLKRLSSLKSSGFFEGVSIRSERNSRTRYIASLDFSFRADAVRAALGHEGVPFVEKQAPTAVLVPVVRDAQGIVQGGGGLATWTEVWKGLDLEHTLTPLNLQGLKPNIPASTLKQLSDGDDRAGSTLSSAYKSNLIVVAIAEPDPATKRLNVTLAGADAVGPINLKRSYRVFDGDTAYTMELAAVVSLGVLEGRWKAVEAGTGGRFSGTPVVLQAQYASLAEWNEMRRQLLNLQGVEDLRIEAESAQSANLSLRYPGGANELAAALYNRGLSLQGAGEGWVLRSGY